MLTTQTQDPTTSTPTSTPKDAATQWKATIEALEAYKRECEAQDQEAVEVAPQDRTYDEDREISRRAAEVERALDDLARECRRLDREAMKALTRLGG